MKSKNQQHKSINIIAIDPSLSCTAMVVNDNKFVYTTKEISCGKKDLKEWFKVCKPFVEYRFHSNKVSSDFSTSQNEKISLYNSITESIIIDIENTIDKSKPTIIGIEGYSQSSKSGPIIDLVSFGSILRYKLKSRFITDLKILAPTLLKLEAAKMTYKPIEKGKRIKSYEWRNNEGIAGGKFTKKEMYKVLTDNVNITCNWVSFLRDIQDKIFSLCNIPKPIEDVNDAKILYEIIKNNTVDKKI